MNAIVLPLVGAALASLGWLQTENGGTTIAREARHSTELRFHPARGEQGVWSASNLQQGLVARASSRGLEVLPIVTKELGAGTWKLTLRTRGFGRMDGMLELPPASVRAEAERVELDHGLLVEWLVNREKGLEQGWTIPAAPGGVEPVRIEVEVAGGLALRVDAGARSGVFVDGEGTPRVRYRGLRAWDASGRDLGASLRPGTGGFGIEIEALGAAYPLTVDPLLTSPAWTDDGDQVGAHFGHFVAGAGDVNGDGYSDVLVAAPDYDSGETDEGRVHLYLGGPAGISTAPDWTAEGNQPNALFGYGLAWAGDVNGDGFSDVLVGAYQYSNGETNEGRVSLYTGSSSGLSSTPAWTAEGNATGAWFGFNAAGAGDVDGDGYGDVLITSFTAGEVQLFRGSSSGLASTPAWTSTIFGPGYGGSIACAGDVNGDGYDDVVIGHNGYANGETAEGGAWVFHGSASGLAASPSWSNESNQVQGQLGRSVSGAGDVNGDGYADVLIGAYRYDNGQTDEGRAQLFLGGSTGLSMAPAWTIEPEQANAELGIVSSAGDVNGDGFGDVLIGAYALSVGETFEGGASVFLGSSTGLPPPFFPSWFAQSDQASAQLGYSLALAGDVNGDGYGDWVVGAWLFDAGEMDEGRAYVFHGSADVPSTSPAWSAESNLAGAGLGNALARAGDVNGDGYGDVIVGAAGYTNGQSNEGRAYVYPGSTTGTLGAPWVLEVNQADASFGGSVAGAGDVNGDGYADVIVGARLHDNIQIDEGSAFLYLGSPTGPASLPAWSAEGGQDDAYFGAWVAGAGDVNGDGYADVLVGAWGYDNGQASEGRAYLYIGSSAGLAAAPAWVAEGNQAGTEFGFCLAGTGDLNGDGFADVAVGALGFDNSFSDAGKVYVYHGSAAGLPATETWSYEALGNWSLGERLAAGGDVNGDSYGDLLIAAPQYTNGESQEGAILVFHGSATGLSSVALTLETNQGGANAIGLASAGDVNGDGYADVLIGANSFDAPENNEGKVFLHLGSASGLSASPAWTIESNQDSAFLASVAGVGDVNADGYADVLLGASGLDNGQMDEGRVDLYLGNEGRGGLLRGLQQRTRNGAKAIPVLGSTGPSGLFRLQAEFPKSFLTFSWASPVTPEAWLEWEVKPAGVPFDGAWLQRGAPQALEPAGGTLSLDELAMIADDEDHARTTAARSYAWRARIATNSPLFPHTAWFSLQGNAPTEASLRKPRRSP